jgi:Restriction endonuclease S subunits
MKFMPYPRYKSSGIEWLGDMPAHWEMKRLKYSASINDEIIPETTSPDFELEYVDIGGVNAIEGITTTEHVVFENAPSRARRKVRHGDIIISTVRTYLRALTPINEPPLNLVVSTGFSVVRPCKIESIFLAYAMRESSFIESVVARSVGVSYPAVNASEIGDLSILLPNFTEQRAIAAFLDRETGKIDRLVAKKRELIERLKEKRTVLISRTVTCGLPSAVAHAASLPQKPQLKPSCIDWLGDIPSHWKITVLKRTWAVCEYGISESLSGEGCIRVLTMGNIQDGRVLIPNDGCLEHVPNEMLLTNGDLLFNRTNSMAHVAKVGIFRSYSDMRVTFASYLVRLRTNDSAMPEFMNYLLNTSQILELSHSLAFPSINQANLNPTRYGQISIPLPPLAEQNTIASFRSHLLQTCVSPRHARSCTDATPPPAVG